MIEIKLDKQKLKEIQKTLAAIPKQIPGVITRSINRTLTTAKTAAIKLITSKTPVTQTRVRRHTRIYKASKNKNFGKVWVGGRAPLSYFKARWRKKKEKTPGGGKRRVAEVMYDIGEGRQTLEPAFMVKIKSGRKAVYMVGGHYMRKKPHSPPPKPLFEGPGGEVMTTAWLKYVPKVQVKAEKVFIKNIESQIQYVLSKRRA